MKFKVDINQYCTEDYHDGEQWGEWRQSYDNSFRGIEICKDEYPDITCLDDVTHGDTAYVVWCEWSHGDSFGHADRGSAEVVAMFKDYETAKKLEEAIYKGPQEKFRFDFEWGSNKIEMYTPWVGYFEHLDDVHIERVTIPNIH